MAFLATNQLPADGYLQAKRSAAQLKLVLQAAVSQMQAGSVSGSFIREGVYRTLARARGVFATVAAIPGIAEYAQAQEDDPAYDPAAEFAAMNASIDDAIAWVAANIPKDAGGFAAIEQWAADGTITDRTFAPAATAGLVTELNAVIATIE